MTTWFTSDTHFWHKAIIGYCNRPIEGRIIEPCEGRDEYNVLKMNGWLIKRWNEKVKPEDEVWHLGDFAFCGSERFKEIVSQLHGRLNWVLGNHDYGLARKDWVKSKFESIQHYKFLRANITYEDDEGETKQYPQPIVLCHFPILSWDGMAHGSWHLHGHCHGSIDRTWNSTGLRMDVGVDAEGNNWSPVSLEEVQTRMALRTVVPVDHHRV